VHQAARPHFHDAPTNKTNTYRPSPPNHHGQLQVKLGEKQYITPDRLAGHPASRVVGVLKRLWKARSMQEICDVMGGFGFGLGFVVGLGVAAGLWGLEGLGAVWKHGYLEGGGVRWWWSGG